jgi:cytochrome c oxidase cbb3-type subunit 3
MSSPGPTHEVDGIIEEDNILPRWWLMTLYGAIVFAAGYWFYYEVYGAGESPVAEYQRLRGEELAREAAAAESAGEVTPEVLGKLVADPVTLAKGKQVFTEICANCHRADGGGNIGPNLTDHNWITDGKAATIALTVREGRVAQGMQAWGPVIGESRVRAVSAYLWSIRNTEVPNGKAPQGEPVVDEAPGAAAKKGT